jgi:hypothetical protein
MVGTVSNDTSQLWALWQAQQAQQSAAAGGASSCGTATQNVPTGFSLTAAPTGGASAPAGGTSPSNPLSTDLILLLQSDGTGGAASTGGTSSAGASGSSAGDLRSQIQSVLDQLETDLGGNGSATDTSASSASQQAAAPHRHHHHHHVQSSDPSQTAATDPTQATTGAADPTATITT